MSLDGIVSINAPTACAGILLAVGMSGAVIFGVAIDSPALSPFAAFGAQIAMSTTPRHGVRARVAGALAGCLFLLLAASLSKAVGGYPFLALLLLFGLSWLAALPKKDLAYVGLVAKFAATAVLLSYFDFTPSLIMGLYFCGGILLGLFLSLAAMAFEQENEQSPLDQLRALFHGGVNNPCFSLITPATVVISSLLARNFAYANPAWVGLTVIFVADPDHTLELRRLLDRVVGTVAGAVISYLLLRHVHMPLQLALIAGLASFLLPFALRSYSLFSLLTTCIVLILIDIAMLEQGGDMRLLAWRCIDTLFGCLCVLVSNLALKSIYWLKERKSKK